MSLLRIITQLSFQLAILYISPACGCAFSVALLRLQQRCGSMTGAAPAAIVVILDDSFGTSVSILFFWAHDESSVDPSSRLLVVRIFAFLSLRLLQHACYLIFEAQMYYFAR